MLNYIENHGIELIIAYYIYISIVGAMPPLPDSAGYYRRWMFQILHAIAGNWKTVMGKLNLPIEETTKEKP